ncbi:hypothetical protein PUN28_006244 [Cardiocondyla obscurior]|uniref:Uncharacterized protein n=1 Tax=Cardiocondyla obscurior TaxID=286306 RepID=A0AAW2G9U9_9HYME
MLEIGGFFQRRFEILLISLLSQTVTLGDRSRGGAGRSIGRSTNMASYTMHARNHRT